MDISWSRNYATTQQLLKLRWQNLHRHVKQSLLVPTQKNELSSFTGYWDIRYERQAPKGLNYYFFHFTLFYYFVFYISTDEVEMYSYHSRNGYFMVTKLRNYSITTEATIDKIYIVM